jgi:hypothetical protein
MRQSSRDGSVDYQEEFRSFSAVCVAGRGPRQIGVVSSTRG